MSYVPSLTPLTLYELSGGLWQSRGGGGGGSGTIADGFGLVKLGTQNLTEVKNQTILSLVLNREKENIQNVRTDKAAGITLLPFSFSWFIVSSAQICTFSGR